MKNSKDMFTTIAASAILALSLCGCGKKAVVFPAPEGVAKSEHYDICADGQNVFAYATYRMDRNSKEKLQILLWPRWHSAYLILKRRKC